MTEVSLRANVACVDFSEVNKSPTIENQRTSTVASPELIGSVSHNYTGLHRYRLTGF